MKKYVKICTACRGINEKEYSFCIKCGSMLPEEQSIIDASDAYTEKFTENDNLRIEPTARLNDSYDFGATADDQKSPDYQGSPGYYNPPWGNNYSQNPDLSNQNNFYPFQPNYSVNNQTQPPKKKKSPLRIVLFSVAAVLILITVGVTAFLLAGGKGMRYALFHEIPSFIGKDINDHEFKTLLEELDEAGIPYQISEGESDFSSYNTIITQNISRTRIKIDHIDFTYGNGMDLTGSDVETAEHKLTGSGWTMQTEYTFVSSEIPQGQIVKQEIDENRKIVTMTVNYGLTDSDIEDCVGMNTEDSSFKSIVSQLESNSIRCRIVESRGSDFRDYGKITSQEITSRNTNGTVEEVTFVKTTEPSFLNLDRKDAVKRLDSLGITYYLVDDKSGSVYDAVTGQSYDPATKSITLRIARWYSETVSASEGFVFPDSATRLIPESEYKSLSYSNLRYATQELYARHGYPFSSSSELRSYYSKFSWYHPSNISAVEVCDRMTATEATNLDHIGGYFNSLH